VVGRGWDGVAGDGHHSCVILEPGLCWERDLGRSNDRRRVELAIVGKPSWSRQWTVGGRRVEGTLPQIGGRWVQRVQADAEGPYSRLFD